MDILEPHDDSRLDTWAKVKGMATFADAHEVSLGRLMVGRKVGDVLQVVDVADHKIGRRLVRWERLRIWRRCLKSSHEFSQIGNEDKTSKKFPKIIRCADFFAFLKKTEQMRRWAWVFRGHGNHGQRWTIESSLHRFLKERSNIIKPKWWAGRQRAALRRFKQGGHVTSAISQKRPTPYRGWL